MAGIYLHIPFCRKKCFYCDFYKTTAVSQKPLFLKALQDEICLQAGYTGGEGIETIYFGGGTPSVMNRDELDEILRQLKRYHTVSATAEITLEANPDDLSPRYLGELREAGINRLSIGIQSFSPDDLRKMNRRHSEVQAVQSVLEAKRAGFDDISIDLIYGLPDLTPEQWERNLNIAMELPANHLSAYHLTYHMGTRFYQWRKKGLIAELSEDDSLTQFEMLTSISAAAGYEQYEISNFARNGAYSKHNSSYWNGSRYLGLGPSAHSYNGASRQWNVADIYSYMRAIQSGQLDFEKEDLTANERLNDFIITRIRTKWGISLHAIGNEFGEEAARHVQHSANSFITTGHLQIQGDVISLTKSGIMISDEIMLALVV
jgi:oxygen-independent coproporphyrinogen III oxidase